VWNECGVLRTIRSGGVGAFGRPCVRALQAGDSKIGDDAGDLFSRLTAFRAEPLRRPVERAEKCSRGDGGIARGQSAAAEAGRHQATDPALVAVALGDNDAAHRSGERVHLEVRGRSLDVSDQTEHVRRRQRAQTLHQRPAAGGGGAQGLEQPIQRSVLAEEQELVLATEVMIEVAGREIGGHGDLAHARGGEAAIAENLRGGAENLDTACLGPPF
jgi:hypothetical protein